MRFLFALTIIALSSCTSSKDATKPEDATTTQEKNIDFTVIKEGTNSGHKTAGAKIIRTTEELSNAWTILYKNYMEKPPLPKIDFNSNLLILVLMGEQTSGGYTVGVKSISETKTETKVTINESKPGKTCMTTSVMTYPYQLVMIPKTNKQIIYSRVENIYECEK